MPIKPINLEIPPGVVAVPTKSSKSTNWQETNLMRWTQTRMQPIGGWAELNFAAFASPIMAIHRWTTKAGIQVSAYLCSQHFYVDTGSGPVDMSPTPAISAPPSPAVGGYGDNKYSLNTYGTPRPAKDPVLLVPSMYTIDNWGEDCVFMTSNDGRLLRWKASTPSVHSAVVPNAPLTNRTFVVTPQRFVILFGAGGDFAKYQWCNEEDIENWTPGVTSAAGDLNVEPASPILTACMSGNDVVFFTANNNGYFIEYKGLPYIYGHTRFQSESIPISPDAIIDTPKGAVWAALDGFWLFSSGTALPIPCGVWDWVNKFIDNTLARRTATFVIIPTFSELYYFFPSIGATTNDRYAVWNFKDGWFAMGQMHRTCGVKSSYTGYPLMSDGVSVYQHESGDSYSLQAGEKLPFARTFNLSSSDGAIMTSWMRMVPDLVDANDVVSFQLDYNVQRDGAVVEMSTGLKPVVQGIVGLDATGRDGRLSLIQTVNTVRKWTMGNTMLETVPRGRA